MEFLLRFDDLPLQGVIFVLPEIAVFELLFGLLLRLLEGIQLFLCSADGFLQSPLLLGEKLGIGRIKFEEAVDVLQLALCIFDGTVDVLQRLFQTCGIASDFHCYAFDASSHATRLLPVKLKIPGSLRA